MTALEKIERMLRQTFGYHLAFAVGYLGMLLPSMDLSDAKEASAILAYILMTLYPTYTAVCGFIFGRRRGFSWKFLLFPVFWYVAATYIRFRTVIPDLWPLCIVDLLAALAGCFVGGMFKRHHDELYL